MSLIDAMKVPWLEDFCSPKEVAEQHLKALCIYTGLTPEVLEQIRNGGAVVIPTRKDFAGESRGLAYITYDPADLNFHLHEVQLNKPVGEKV